MDVTTSILCDKMLKAALDGLYLMEPRYFSFQQLCEVGGATSDQSEAALLWLCKNSYLEKTKNTFVLTPPGEAFALGGGYAGQREREKKEEEAKQGQRYLIEEQREYAKTTKRATVFIAIATVVYAMVAILQWLLPLK